MPDTDDASLNDGNKTPDVYDVLERVVDRNSLIVFVNALSVERSAAATLERAESTRYSMGGALDWQNSDICGFLDGACEFLHHHVNEDDAPTWRMIAEFLWCGKIME